MSAAIKMSFWRFPLEYVRTFFEGSRSKRRHQLVTIGSRQRAR